MKGALEEVVNSCSTYNHGGIPLPLTPQQRAFYQQEEEKMGTLGLRGQYLQSPAPSSSSRATRTCTNAGFLVRGGSRTAVGRSVVGVKQARNEDRRGR